MKLKLSKITLWFTGFGLGVALLEVVISTLYRPDMDPIAEGLLSGIGTVFLPLCPFALAERELPNVHIWADRVWIYFEIVALNTLSYFVLGLICSFLANIVRQVIANRPRPR